MGVGRVLFENREGQGESKTVKGVWRVRCV